MGWRAQRPSPLFTALTDAVYTLLQILDDNQTAVVPQETVDWLNAPEIAAAKVIACIGFLGTGRSGKSTLASALASYLIRFNPATSSSSSSASPSSSFSAEIAQFFETSNETTPCTLGINVVALKWGSAEGPSVVFLLDSQGLEHGYTGNQALIVGFLSWLSSHLVYVEDGVVTYRTLQSLATVIPSRLRALTSPRMLNHQPLLVVANKVTLAKPSDNSIWWRDFVSLATESLEVAADAKSIRSTFLESSFCAIEFIEDADVLDLPIDGLVELLEVSNSGIPLSAWCWDALPNSTITVIPDRATLASDFGLTLHVLRKAYRHKENATPTLTYLETFLQLLCGNALAKARDYFSQQRHLHLLEQGDITGNEALTDLQTRFDALAAQVTAVYLNERSSLGVDSVIASAGAPVAPIDSDTQAELKRGLDEHYKLLTDQHTYLNEVISQTIEMEVENSEPRTVLSSETKSGSMFHDDYQKVYDLSLDQTQRFRMKMTLRNGSVRYTNWVSGPATKVALGSRSVRWSEKSGFAKGLEIGASFIAAAGLAIITGGAGAAVAGTTLATQIGTAAATYVAAGAAGLSAATTAGLSGGFFISGSVPLPSGASSAPSVDVPVASSSASASIDLRGFPLPDPNTPTFPAPGTGLPTSGNPSPLSMPVLGSSATAPHRSFHLLSTPGNEALPGWSLRTGSHSSPRMSLFAHFHNNGAAPAQASVPTVGATNPGPVPWNLPPTMTDTTARSILEAEGIRVNALEPQTSLGGVHREALAEIINLQRDLQAALGRPVPITVTGGKGVVDLPAFPLYLTKALGTELIYEKKGNSLKSVHNPGPLSHMSGWKLDISNKDADVNAYIRTHFKPIADRKDPGGPSPRYQHGSATFTEEIHAKHPHWDIQITPPPVADTKK